MKAQKPAQGILLQNDWGTSKMYKAVCECGNDDCSHIVDVEADEFGVNVTVYTTEHTNFWKDSVKPRYDIDNVWLQEFDWFWKGLWNGLMIRLRLTKDIWFNGYAKYQSSLYMNEQVALNYAETLKSAVVDVQNFKKSKDSKKENTAAVKAANEQDCV